MVSISVNDIEYKIKSDISILEACKYVGVHIPRFCYHEKLSVAGNCRMCLVEIDPFEKPFASCATDITENMEIYVDTPFVKKARESILEMILLNHPLDCPICDQAGECDLQDQAKEFGSTFSKFYFNKKSSLDDYRGPLISTIMTRCISCTRCVRYGDEVAGVNFFGTINRGNDMKISTYVSKIIESEISGNVIDLCPVGALTASPHKFAVRPWEVTTIESIDTSDSLGSNTYVNWKENQIVRILPRPNVNINHTFLADKARFVCDANLENRLINDKDEDIYEVLNSIKEHISNASTIVFFVDENLDLETLMLLKNLQNMFFKKVQIIVLNSSVDQNNFYTNSNFQIEEFSNVDKVNTQLIGTNLRSEAPILNYRLRSLHLFNNYKVENLGPSVDLNIENNHSYLGISKIFNKFEGLTDSSKQYRISQTINIFGQSIINLISNFIDLKHYINKLYKYNSIIHIFPSSNTAGVNLLNTHYIKPRDNAFYIFVNLIETQFLMHLANKIPSSNKLIFNTYAYNEINQTSEYIIGCTNEFEESKLYVNAFDMPQKTEAPNNMSTAIKPVSNWISNIFEVIKGNSSISHLISIAEQYPSSYVKKIFAFYLNTNSLTKYFNSFQISKHILKIRNKSYYISNNLTRQSATLIEASRLQLQHSQTYILG